MATAVKVLRTFFIDPSVDMRLARLALEAEVSKNEFTRALLHEAMTPYVSGERNLDELQPAPAKDAKTSGNMVMRSIYLDALFDEYLRTVAFDIRRSKGDIMRSLIDRQLAAGRPTRAERSPRARTSAAKAPVSSAKGRERADREAIDRAVVEHPSFS